MYLVHCTTVFPHIRPAGIIILCSIQMRVLLENTTFLLHKVIRIAGIIRVAGIISTHPNTTSKQAINSQTLKSEKNPNAMVLPHRSLHLFL